MSFFEREYVPVPGGYALSECIHEVPDGSHIHETKDLKTFVGIPSFF